MKSNTRTVGATAIAAMLSLVPQSYADVAMHFTTTGVTFHPTLNATRGYEFQTSHPIVVNSLGLFDFGKDGLAASHKIGIWDTSANLLASVTIPAGTSSPLAGVDSFRYTPLSPSISLAPGFYLIGAAYVDGDPDVISYQNGPVGAAGSIAYIQPRFSPDGSGFAAPIQLSAATGGAFGPNFQFSVPEPSAFALAFLGPICAGCFVLRRNLDGKRQQPLSRHA